MKSFWDLLPASPLAHHGITGRPLPKELGSETLLVNRPAPFQELPVILQNPFDFPRSVDDLIVDSYLWPKLLFNSSSVGTAPYMLGTYGIGPELLAPIPFAPAGEVPHLDPPGKPPSAPLRFE